MEVLINRKEEKYLVENETKKNKIKEIIQTPELIEDFNS